MISIYKESTSDTLIRESNLLKKESLPAVVVLQSSKDETGALSDSSDFLHGLETLAKTHYIYKKTIAHKDIGSEIDRAKESLGNRKIDVLWLRAHGEPNSIELGDEFYRREDVRTEDFNALHAKAIIVIDSCSTGVKGGLAERIAEVQPRAVYAAKKTLNSQSFVAKKNGRIEWEGRDGTQSVGAIYQRKGHRVVGKPTLCHSVIFREHRKNAAEGSTHDQLMLADQYYHQYVENNKNTKAFNRAIALYKKAAEKNDLAKNRLFFIGIFEQKDVKIPKSTCYKYFLEKAQAGEMKAMRTVAYCRTYGVGVAQDLNEAVKWYKKAAEQPNGLSNLKDAAEIYENQLASPILAALLYQELELASENSPQNALKAIEGLIRCAKKVSGKGDLSFAEAINIVKEYPIGKELSKLPLSEQEIYKEMTKAAIAGNANAMYYLGLYEENGIGTEQSYVMANYWYQQAAQNQSIQAYERLGNLHELGLIGEPDLQKAASYYREGGEKGDEKARAALIRLHSEKTGLKSNFEWASSWSRKGCPVQTPQACFKEAYQAARSGNYNAQLALGTYYENGFGIGQSYSHARTWYQWAYRSRIPDAGFALGNLYEKGLGIEAQWHIAADYYCEVGERGHEGAQEALIRLHREITGRNGSFEEAQQWVIDGCTPPLNWQRFDQHLEQFMEPLKAL